MIVYIAEKPDIATAMAAYCDVGLRAYHDDSHA